MHIIYTAIHISQGVLLILLEDTVEPGLKWLNWCIPAAILSLRHQHGGTA